MLLALLLWGRNNRRNPKYPRPTAILDDIVWLGALFFVNLVSSFGFAAGAMMSAGDLRAFAIAVTCVTLSVSGLAFTRVGFRLAAFSSSISDDPPRRYPVANDH